MHATTMPPADNSAGMDLRQAEFYCRRLAMQAGEVILNIYATDFDVDYKADASPLTQADLAANNLIVAGLRGEYPGCAILSEESQDDPARLANRWCFIVDPLDGTKEFVNRNGEFTVNIALADAGRAVVGVIYVPVTGALYSACEGSGAWTVTKDGAEVPLRVTGKTDQLVYVGSRSHATEKERALVEAHAGHIAAQVSAGSSLKGCMVAEGKADVYYRSGPTCEWDTAAMQCIVEQAGGIFRQWNGEDMRYNRQNVLNEHGFFAVNRKENIWI